jgi:hypothetical protein
MHEGDMYRAIRTAWGVMCSESVQTIVHQCSKNDSIMIIGSSIDGLVFQLHEM